MKKIILLASLTISTCSWANTITEQEAISKLNQFFTLLDLEVYDKEKVSTILTDNFIIFETLI